MTTSIFRKLIAIACLSFPFCMIASCSDDDNNTNKTLDVDNDAGTFSVTNISYDESTGNSSMKALDGDTLKILFKPKNKYLGITFAIESSSLTPLNDSLFQIKNLKAGDNDITLTATYKKETDTLSIEYYKAETLKVNKPEAYVIIPYHLIMSKDLDELVQPEVSYTDADDNVHTFMVPSDNISMQEQSSTYDFKVRYYKVDISSKVTVSYKPRKDVELSKDRYYLSHYIDSKSADIKMPSGIYIDNYSSTHININIGGDDGIPKEKVSEYLDNLAKTPDVLQLRIDPDNGGITVIKE